MSNISDITSRSSAHLVLSVNRCAITVYIDYCTLGIGRALYGRSINRSRRMKVPAKARTSTVLVFLIGLSVVAAEAQRGLLFTVVNTPMVSNPVFSGFSLQLFSQASLGYLQAGSAFHTPYAEFSYDIYSGPRGVHRPRYFRPIHHPCWNYSWDPLVGLFNDWIWGCDLLPGLAYRSTYRPWNRIFVWTSFHSRPPPHAFAYWRDPFVPPWGPHWTQDPWAPFWDGYWDEPGFGGHYPVPYPAVPAIADPEAPTRTATRRPSSRIGSPRGYGEGAARVPGRSAVPRTSNPPGRWGEIPVLDSRDPKEPTAKPRAKGSKSPPSDLIYPPSAHPSADPRRASRAGTGKTAKAPRPSDRIGIGTVSGTKTGPRPKPKSRNRSPYPSFDRSPAPGKGVSNNPSLGRRPSPKTQARPKAYPRSPGTKPAPNHAPRTKAAPSSSRAPRALATPRPSPKMNPGPTRQPSRSSSTARRARRPGN